VEFRSVALVGSWVVVFAGCSGTDPDASADGSGGAATATGGTTPVASGGKPANTGGKPANTGGKPSASGGTTSTGGTTPTGDCTPESTNQGEATFYTFADGSGNCSFDATPNDLLVGAMNATDYADSAACGACAAIDGPDGSVTVRIVDQCPECPKGNIDLSPEAFDHLAQRSLGRVPIKWKYVPCSFSTPSTPLSYRFKEGSSQYWTAVQVRNHRYRIATFEYLKDGAYVRVARESYNYFVEPHGMGVGPYTFRTTDVYGQVVIDANIAFADATVVPGKGQFPACTQ